MTNIQSFRNFLLEAKTPGNATVFEEYIVEAWNILLQNPKATPAFESSEFSDPAHQKFAPIAFKIASTALKQTGSRSKMIHSGADIVSISREFMEYGGVDKTPKADIRTEDNKYRLSLKENKASQLISGGKTDAFPVFKIAEDNFSKTSDGLRAIEDVFTQILDRIEPPKSAKGLIDTKYMTTKGRDDKLPGIMDVAKDPELRKQMPADVNQFLDKVTFVDDKFKNGLTDELNKLFNTNQIFKQFFTYEAASGEVKFVEIPPVSNSFLIFSSKNGAAKVKTFDSHDSKEIVTLSRKVKFRFRWKHGSKVVLALDIPKEVLEDMDLQYSSYSEMLNEEFEQSNLLNEGIGDFFSRAKEWLKGFAKRVVNYIKKLAALGMKYVYSFFNVEMVGVDFNNPTVS